MTNSPFSFLERNVVVRDGATATTGRTRWRASGIGPGRHAAFTAGSAAKHHHVAGSNFGGFSFHAFLVVPFPGLKASFDIYQSSFGQVLVANFRKAVPYNDAVPFGAFLFFTRTLIGPGIVGGNGEPAERGSAGGVLHF